MKARVALLLATAAILAVSSLALGSTRTMDFNSGYGEPDRACNMTPPPNPPMFNRPGYGYQTSAYVDGTDGCGYGAFDQSLGTDSVLTDDYSVSGACNELRFSWASPADDKAWVRVPTYTAGSTTPTSPNPTVHLGVGSSISMRIMAFGTDGNVGGPEAWVETGQLEIALCIRETGANVPIGADGGATGTVEFVGIDTRGVTGDANTPVGGIVLNSSGAAAPGEFATVKWTFVDNLPEGAPDGAVDGVDVTVTPYGGSPTVYHKSIVAFSGDSILSAANNRGTLDSLALRKPEGDDATKKWYVDIDDVVIDAPGVVDPVMPPQMPGAVMPSDTQVTVSGIDSWTPASQVRLLKNHADFSPPQIANPAGSDTYTFASLTLAEGDVLTATQTILGVESAESAPVQVTAVILKDNFDSYADQAALNAVWPTAGCIQPNHITLTQRRSASCNQSILEPASSSGTVCGLERDLGAYYDGTDALPLTLTIWMNHSTGTSIAKYVELRSYNAAGAMQQLLAIGAYNYGTESATYGGDTADPTVYQGREAYGGTGIPNWFNITGATRTPNTWVKLQIKVKTSTVDYIVNDTTVSTQTRFNASYQFNSVVIGSRAVSGGEAFYDNVSLSFGEPPIDPYFTNPVAPPTLPSQILPQVTSVTVNGVIAGATQVKVYADGSLVGSASASVPATVVTVSNLACGAVITATQVKDGVESCYSEPVTVRNPLPTVATPLAAGDTTVTVTNVDATATQVKVYSNNSLIGTAAAVSPSTVVTVSPALQGGAIVEAAQIINTYECGRSTPVAVPAPILNGWTLTSLLPVGTGQAVALYLNGYMYCIGGSTSAAVVTGAVYYAPVNSDGSLGAWTATTSLPSTEKTTHAGAAYNGRLYVWGGYNNAGPTQGTCFYAQPNPDGTISSWTQSAVSLPAPGGVQQMELLGNGVQIYKDNIYTINGANNNGTAQSACYVSKIGSSGEIGAWQATTATDDARKWLNTAVVQTPGGDYIYRIGGADLSYTAQPDSVKGTLAADGSITSWTAQSSLIPTSPAVPILTGLYAFACAVADNRIFIIGGNGDDNASNTLVFFNEVDPANGDLGPWKQEVHPYPLKIGRNSAIGYEVNGAWYVMGVGGQQTWNSSPTRRRECYFAKLNTTGCATPTVTSITPPEGRQDNAACHVTIAGTNFVDGSTAVVLRKTGQADITASNITVASGGASLTADFDLIGKALGMWDVAVTTCATATLSSAFEVKPPLPTVTSITPNTGVQDNGNREVNPSGAPRYLVGAPPLHVTIVGTNFATGATVKLVQTGKTDINAANVVVVDASHITADIDLTGAAPGALNGAWDVVVTTTEAGTLPSGFTVSMCFSPRQDADGDGDVDLTDFGVFQGCFNGPNRPYNPPPVDQRKCTCIDMHEALGSPAVDDVDLADFGKFQGCFNGPNRPPNAGC